MRIKEVAGEVDELAIGQRISFEVGTDPRSRQDARGRRAADRLMLAQLHPAGAAFTAILVATAFNALLAHRPDAALRDDHAAPMEQERV